MERLLIKDIIFEIFKYLSQKDIVTCRHLKVFSGAANEFISMKYNYYSNIKHFDMQILEKFCSEGEYLAVVYFIYRYERQKLSFRSMILACKSGNADIVKLLMKNKCHLWECSFLWICEMGHKDILEMLLAIDDSNWNWGAGVYEACKRGHMEVVEFLIEKAEKSYNWDWNYCLEGACEGANIGIIKLLIEKGASNWNQCLGSISEAEQLEIIEFALKKATVCID